MLISLHSLWNILFRCVSQLCYSTTLPYICGNSCVLCTRWLRQRAWWDMSLTVCRISFLKSKWLLYVVFTACLDLCVNWEPASKTKKFGNQSAQYVYLFLCHSVFILWNWGSVRWKVAPLTFGGMMLPICDVLVYKKASIRWQDSSPPISGGT